MRLTRSMNEAGVTLMELLVVMAIIGVMAGVGIPAYLAYLPKARLNGAARQVMSDLILARRQAVGHTRKVKIFFPDEPDGHDYKICYDADADGEVTEADCAGSCQNDTDRNGQPECKWRGSTKNLQSNYYDITIPKKANDPVFHPRGIVSPTACIVLGNREASKPRRYITISNVGRTRIMDKQPLNSCQ